MTVATERSPELQEALGPGSPIVVFDRVSLAFDDKVILREVSFTLIKGHTKIFLGASGAGKSTILKVIVGLLKPDSGVVWVNGERVDTKAEPELMKIRNDLGMVFQEGALFDSMSVAENVAYRLREDHVPEEEIEPRVLEVLRFVELEQTLELLPSELSGGMRRRVSIARALINHPAIVLYDSPTAGLDPVTSQTIITLILRLRDVYGVTALLATHRLQDGFALANFHFDAETKRVVVNAQNGNAAAAAKAARTRFLVYRDGGIYFEGEPEEIADSNDPYLKRFLV